MQEILFRGHSFHAFEPFGFGGGAFCEALIGELGAFFCAGRLEFQCALDEFGFQRVALGGVSLDAFGVVEQGGAMQFFVSPIYG